MEKFDLEERTAKFGESIIEFTKKINAICGETKENIIMKKIRIIAIIGFLLVIGWGVNLQAVNRYSVANGDWNSTATWSEISGGGAGASAPVAGDAVYIERGCTVSVTEDAACATINFPTTATTNNLNINSGITLDVSGAITIPRAGSGYKNTIAVGAGNLNAGSIAFPTDGSDKRHELTIYTGRVTVAGNIINNSTNTSPTITFTGAGLLQLGGSIYYPTRGTLTTVTGSTVEYNKEDNQTVEPFNYNKLTLSGSGAKTLITGMTSIADNLTLSGTASTSLVDNFTIGGDLIIGGGAGFTATNRNLTVSGTTTVGNGLNGNLTISSATGTKKFNGLVTINSNATWDNSANSAITFCGGITNNGTFTAGTGVQTFTTNPQALNGTFSIPSVAITGITLTNNGILTVTTALTGSGELINAGTGILNINFTGAVGITTLTASAGDNIVNYGYAGAQTIFSTTYHHLTLSGGTGNKTASGACTINGDLEIGSGATLIAGAYTHTLKGNWDNQGTFDAGSGAVILNGASIQTLSGSTFNNLTIDNTAGITLLSDETVAGTLALSNGVVTTGSYTMIIGSVGSVLRTNGYINGYLQKYVSSGTSVTETFEVGETYYAPVSLTFSAVNTDGNLTVTSIDGDHSDIDNSGIDADKSVNRYWTLTNSGIEFTTCDATFNFDELDIDEDADYAQFYIAKKDGSVWTFPTIGTRDQLSTQATGIDALSDFQIGEKQAYTISGTITDGQRAAIPGVLVTATVGFEGSDETDEFGDYTIEGVPENTNDITLTPTKDGYIFTPEYIDNIDVTNQKITGQDFVGTLLTYSISGNVGTGVKGPIPGVLVTATVGLDIIGSGETDVDGNYTIEDVPHGTENITLTATKTGYTFNGPIVITPPLTGSLTGKNFIGTLLPPVVPGWYNTNIPIPTEPVTGKAVKDGGAMVVAVPQEPTDDGNVIYAFKGWKSKMFKMFDGASWTDKAEIPFAIRTTEPLRYYKKYPGKGASLCWNEGDIIYATKGNNTFEFWAYDITKEGTKEEPWAIQIPVPAAKKLKGGTSMVWYDGKVYLLAGGQKKDIAVDNFFVYDPTVEEPTWSALDKLELGVYNRTWKDGSCLAVTDDGTIYALKGGDKQNYLYAYNISTRGWTLKDSMPLKYPTELIARPKTTRVKDGGAMTTDGSNLYAIKGGGKQDFWMFTPGTDAVVWTPLDTIPRITVAYRRSVPKTGAALAYLDGKVYLLKGNKLDEFWYYVPGATKFERVNPSTITTTTGDVTTKLNFSLTATMFSRIVNYTIPVAGKVSLKLYNASGRLVKTIHNGYMNAGIYTTTLSKVSSGVYFLKYTDGTNSADVKLIVQ